MTQLMFSDLVKTIAKIGVSNIFWFQDLDYSSIFLKNNHNNNNKDAEK